MKLRTRLFLWVGGLFLIFFLLSFILENLLIHRNLNESENRLRKAITDANAARLAQFDDFLGLNLAKILADIDALLFSIYQTHYMQKSFSTAAELKNVSAELAEKNKWIDLVQCTYQKTSSGVIPYNANLYSAHFSTPNEEFSWVTLEGAQQGPIFGMHFKKIDQNKELILLLDEKKLAKLDLMQISGPLQEKLAKAKDYLDLHKKKTKKAARSCASTVGEESARSAFLQELTEGDAYHSTRVRNEFTDYVNTALDRDEKQLLAFALSSIGPELPVLGIALQGSSKYSGKALLSEEIFLPSQIFDDAAFYANNHKGNASIPISSSVAFIVDEKSKNPFFGNTLALIPSSSKIPNGYITIAVSIEDIVEHLALATGQIALLAFEGKVASAYEPTGAKLTESQFFKIPFERMVTDVGEIDLGGTRYDYMRMTPFQTGNLHFYIFQPSSKAINVIQFLDQGTRALIHTLSLNMALIAIIALIIALVFLNNVSKRITRPIRKLAEGAAAVSEGHYENLEIDKEDAESKDEMGILIHSFAEMVKGLQDREKVRGVLNKVVSKEIAAEILNGNVHLGGEERKVAMLFADIRGFTHITEKMAPKDVILLLNECMTKISLIIDEQGGVIDKYVGDEVMALFGAPLAQEDSAYRAIICAVKMVQRVDQWNEERKQKGLLPVEIGVGIHIGSVVAGNMGAENRLNYTVLGANVNLAARLCSAAGPQEILITEAVLQAPKVKETVAVKALAPMKFKGFSEEVKVYNVQKILLQNSKPH